MATDRVIDGVVHLSGPLTFATVAERFRDCARLLDDSAGVAVLDLAEVPGVDSAGLALLLEWQAMARQRGKELEFRNAPRDLLRLAALSEASGLLGLMPVPELAHDELV